MRVLTCSLAALVVPALACLASAQISYDAGTAGNPPVAPSPTTQGWSETISGGVTVTDISPDSTAGINAWQVNDLGTGEALYSTNQMPLPYEVSLTMRILAGSAKVVIDTGDILTDSLFEIEFESDGVDVRVHRPFGPPIVCPGGAIGYHEYRLSGRLYQLLLRYDGELRGLIDESGFGLDQDGQGVSWGTGVPAGRVRFHQIHVRDTDRGLIFNSLPICFPAVPNSSGSSARMIVAGNRTVANDDLTLLAQFLPTTSNIGYFIMGTGANEFVPPGAAGPICVSPGLKRFLPPVNNTTQLNGAFARDVGTSGPVSSAITAGSTWRFQAWFRDGMNPSNLTNAVEVNFQ